jgi:hypothetical protein
LSACSSPERVRKATAVGAGFEARPTRGVVLISLDTVRADHLSCYGYERRTTPFLDSLTERAVVFEYAVAQYPATLISHMSMFTGYYPRQHGVFPPAAVLAPEIETVPERLQAAGVRTAGHTEGGYVSGGYGFARGFEEFSDTPYSDDTDVERTFTRGLEFIERLDETERFFVFLHTYSVHDPYDPPAEYRDAFWDGEPILPFAPDGPALNDVNRGFRDLDPAAAEYFTALYDASILYVDRVLERFFARLEELGVADETTVIITSDHGEEFLDHGKMVHEQIYPESSLVPLIVAHPDLDHPIRVVAPVQLIDLAPTIYELAGVEVPEGLAGVSLGRYFEDPGGAPTRPAYAEVLFPSSQKSLLVQRDDEIVQLLLFEHSPEHDGTWVPGSYEFDTAEERLDLLTIAYKKARTLEILVNGRHHSTVEVPNGWTPLTVDLPRRKGGNRVTFIASDCDAQDNLPPDQLQRCLSIKVRGVPFRRTELFNLSRDAGAAIDLYRKDPALAAELHRLLRRYRWEPLAESSRRELDDRTRQLLEALGYL